MSVSDTGDTGSRPTVDAVFTHGSVMRHVLVMTATGSVGLVSIFAVDFLSLLYVSWLGDPRLVAGVGYATQVLFSMTAINIGLTIGVTALVARAAGAGRDARTLAGACLLHVFVFSGLVAIAALAFRAPFLRALGATGETFEVADRFLLISVPANPLLALGMSLSGVLRAHGDAQRSMYVTLFGGIASAVLDPLLIFGLHLGVDGAAWSTACSRIAFVATGFWGASRVHDLLARPPTGRMFRDAPALLGIAGPAILTNLAAPVGNSYAMHVFSRFGEATVAAFVIVDRITPVAFGVLFALTGAVGPIIGQNFGAGLWSRVRRTLADCLLVGIGYSVCVWIVLFLGGPHIADIFGASGRTREIVLFFCSMGAAIWLFLGCLFVANAAFNNLGFPLFATVFNWGRATLGTIPFVTLGASLYGPEGGYGGMIVGSAIFGMAAVATAFLITSRMMRRTVLDVVSVQDPAAQEQGSVDRADAPLERLAVAEYENRHIDSRSAQRPDRAP